jgi:hypothetical protein
MVIVGAGSFAAKNREGAEVGLVEGCRDFLAASKGPVSESKFREVLDSLN